MWRFQKIYNLSQRFRVYWRSGTDVNVDFFVNFNALIPPVLQWLTRARLLFTLFCTFAFPNDLLAHNMHRKESHTLVSTVFVCWDRWIDLVMLIADKNTPRLVKEGMSKCECQCECIYVSDRDRNIIKHVKGREWGNKERECVNQMGKF